MAVGPAGDALEHGNVNVVRHAFDGGVDDELQETREVDVGVFGGAGQAHAFVETGIAIHIQNVGQPQLIQANIDATIAPTAHGTESSARQIADAAAQFGIDLGRAEDVGLLVIDRVFQVLRRIGHDGRNLFG